MISYIKIMYVTITTGAERIIVLTTSPPVLENVSGPELLLSQYGPISQSFI